MKMPKASDADKDRFRDLIETVAHIPGVEVKPMFGQLGAFVNGNMFAGLFGSSIGVKLDEEAAGELREPAAVRSGPRSAPWAATSPSLAGSTPATGSNSSASHIATLPPKSKNK